MERWRTVATKIVLLHPQKNKNIAKVTTFYNMASYFQPPPYPLTKRLLLWCSKKTPKLQRWLNYLLHVSCSSSTNDLRTNTKLAAQILTVAHLMSDVFHQKLKWSLDQVNNTRQLHSWFHQLRFSSLDDILVPLYDSKFTLLKILY
jgi:hypothetical protein